MSWVRLSGWEVSIEETGGVDLLFEELEGFGVNGEDSVKVGQVFLVGGDELEVEG